MKLELTLWIALIGAALVLFVMIATGRGQDAPEIETDNITLRAPKVSLVWEPAPGQQDDEYEVQIAQNRCHIGGRGLIRAKTTDTRLELVDICEFREWKFPLFGRVRARKNDLWSVWAEKFFALKGEDDE